MLEQCVTIEGAASFSGFARPKTALQPETERSLTSEFGTGSGGSRALWPATEVSRFLGAYKRDGEQEEETVVDEEHIISAQFE